MAVKTIGKYRCTGDPVIIGQRKNALICSPHPLDYDPAAKPYTGR